MGFKEILDKLQPEGLRQTVVFGVVGGSFLLWLIVIQLTFWFEGRVSVAEKYAYTKTDYEPIFDTDVIMKMISIVQPIKKSYIWAIIMLALIVIAGAFVVFLFAYFKGFSPATLLHGWNNLTLLLAVLGVYIGITFILSALLYLATAFKVHRVTRNMRTYESIITGNLTHNSGFLDMLTRLPTGITINPNINNQSQYYVPDMGFASGDEKEAAKLIFTAKFYLYMMNNTSAMMDEVRERVRGLFNPTTVALKRLVPSFAALGQYIRFMTPEHMFNATNDNNWIEFLTANVLCEDVHKCEDEKKTHFAKFYRENHVNIDEHVQKMIKDLKRSAAIADELKTSFTVSKEMMNIVKWLNAWIPTLLILGIGAGIAGVYVEGGQCRKWRMVGGAIFAVGMLGPFLRTFAHA